jgi:hypothetical protein
MLASAHKSTSHHNPEHHHHSVTFGNEEMQFSVLSTTLSLCALQTLITHSVLIMTVTYFGTHCHLLLVLGPHGSF